MNQLLKITLLITLTLFMGCSKSELQHEDQYEQSVRKWEIFKREASNNYLYTRTSSSFTGWSSEITIWVRQGKIDSVRYMVPQLGRVSRPKDGWTSAALSDALQEMGYAKDEINDERLNKLLQDMEWSENKSQAGAHGNHYLMTMDDIYRMAKTEWLVIKKGITNYFETQNNGLISVAGNYSEGCQDDCFNGVKIKTIQKIQ